jgi:hypothetical protein
MRLTPIEVVGIYLGAGLVCFVFGAAALNLTVRKIINAFR